jgi:beta-lactamase regulating signal transducer with metallopeptidase domain
MTPWSDPFSVDLVLSRVSSLLIATLVKGFVVYAIVSLFVVKARGLSPAHRHLFWFFAVASCLLVPPLALLSPSLRVVDLPLLGARSGAFRTFFAALSARVQTAVSPLQPAAAGQAPRVEAAGRSVSAVFTVDGGNFFSVVDAGVGSAFSAVSAGGRLPRPSFACWALCAWAAGAAFFLSSIVAGAVKLRKLLQGARSPGGSRFSRALEFLHSGAAGGRKVRLLTSGMCRVPFACGVLRPVILFPASSARWPVERIRAVLAHELAHVRRMDYLTRLVSRTVCSLFWFAPHLWAANARLHMEQEKAADAFTVRSGTKPDDYARHLLDLARVLKRSDSLLAGLFAPGNRKSALERRVVDILRMKAGSVYARATRFLRSFALCLLCAMPLLIFNPAFRGAGGSPAVSPAFTEGASAKEYSQSGPHSKADVSAAVVRVDPSDAFARIAGTWINEEYGNVYMIYREGQKFVVSTDGWAELWSKIDAMGPTYVAYYEIEKSWVDSEGRLYCQVRRKRTPSLPGVTTELWRLTPSGRVLELIYIHGTQEEFPVTIDPSAASAGHISYRIYYRGGDDVPAGRNSVDAAEALARMTGTWVNADYDTNTSPNVQKIVIKAGYRMEYWSRVGGLGPSGSGACEISKSWVGGDGCLYCEARVNAACNGECVELWKLDKSGKVWEKAFVLGKGKAFPDKVIPNPDDSFTYYAVYRRE